MRSVTVQEAKAQLSRLLREVEQGDDVEIRRGHVPVALLTARRPAVVDFADLRGRFAGEVEISERFDDLDDETARAFGVIE